MAEDSPFIDLAEELSKDKNDDTPTKTHEALSGLQELSEVIQEVDNEDTQLSEAKQEVDEIITEYPLDPFE